MKKLLVVGLLLNAVFLAGRFWQELPVDASGGRGAGGSPCEMDRTQHSIDANADGGVDISDAVYLLSWLFGGGPAPQVCLAGSVGGLTPEQEEILSHISVIQLEDGQGGTVKTIRFTGVNVQIVNGLDATNGNTINPNQVSPEDTVTNGAGNLIVGYQETRGDSEDDRTGSHNIVVGSRQNYSSFGCLVAGHSNSATGAYSSVSAGRFNRAEGNYSSVNGGGGDSGGLSNIATGEYASVAGGRGNRASGDWSSVGGGRDNQAVALAGSVSGGLENIAGDAIDPTASRYASVSGGRDNRATGLASSVSGGRGSRAELDYECLGDSYSLPRFVDNGDGTVSDKWTGLMWQKAADDTLRNWDQAERYCDELELGGHSDWRMPTIEELRSIVDETRSNPAIDPVFVTPLLWFWSSTSSARASGVAWIVHADGSVTDAGGSLSNAWLVRAVRNGS